ncbi:MAG: phage major capsid protein, partial [Candidatus Binataceae bacterium]
AETCERVGKGFEDFKASYDKKLAAETQLRENLERKLNLESMRGNRDASERRPALAWRDAKSGRPVPVLERKHLLASLDEKSSAELPSIGRVLRGIILGGRADDAKELDEERKALGVTPDPSGGYTVSGTLSSRWIDLLRAASVLQRAGMLTVPMETGEMTIARVTANPAVSWQAENAALSAADPTFAAVKLQARTAVVLVKVSLELAQDSSNIEGILETTLTGALASAIDGAGLNGIVTGAGAAPTGVFNTANINKITGIGALTNFDFLVDGLYELMLDNVSVEDIGALIAHPRVWRTLRRLKTGLASDQTPLVPPQEIAGLPKLWTTAAPLTGTTAKAVIADWRSLLFGVRKQIEVRVLREAFMGSNLQVAVLAYARVDFAVTRPTDFCSLEGITVV